MFYRKQINDGKALSIHFLLPVWAFIISIKIIKSEFFFFYGGCAWTAEKILEHIKKEKKYVQKSFKIEIPLTIVHVETAKNFKTIK